MIHKNGGVNMEDEIDLDTQKILNVLVKQASLFTSHKEELENTKKSFVDKIKKKLKKLFEVKEK